MAVTELIAATTSAATSGSFTASGPFALYGTGFEENESAVLEQEISPGVFRKATGDKGFIGVTKFPNSILFDAAGTFRVVKSVTKSAASVGWEVQ